MSTSGCQPQRRGFTRQSESRAQLVVPALQNTKIPREDRQEREKKEQIVVGEGQKRAKLCAAREKAVRFFPR